MCQHKHFTRHKIKKTTATKHKSICAEVFYKKGLLKNFPGFIDFADSLRQSCSPTASSATESNTDVDVLQGILENIKEHLQATASKTTIRNTVKD